MNACDACGLKRTSEDYARHNCFLVIKQTGRSDLAGEILAAIASMDDAKALDYIRQTLRTESKAMPDLEPQELAQTA